MILVLTLILCNQGHLQKTIATIIETGEIITTVGMVEVREAKIGNRDALENEILDPS